jgi:hypothetical protein
MPYNMPVYPGAHCIKRHASPERLLGERGAIFDADNARAVQCFTRYGSLESYLNSDWSGLSRFRSVAPGPDDLLKANERVVRKRVV